MQAESVEPQEPIEVALQDEDLPVAPADESAVCETGAGDTGGGAAPIVRLPAQMKRAEIVYHVEFKNEAACRAFRAAGVNVFHRFQRWADLHMANDRGVLLALASNPGVYWIDPLAGVSVPPPRVGEVVASRATPEAILRGGLRPWTGKGVVVAVVDSGVDFRHPDFISYGPRRTPTSRLLWLWDTTLRHQPGRGAPGPVRYSNGVPIGTVFSRQDLTADLRAAKPRIGVTDRNGHGTSCAGVAAGNGNGHARRRYTGVAPEADIIGVRIGGSSGEGLENAYLLGAICDWVDAMAGARPAVLSCSFGGQQGGRDGARVIERQLDARFADGVRGRAICIAAGNDATRQLHARIRFSSVAPAKLQWRVRGKPAQISMFVTDPTCTALELRATGPKGAKLLFQRRGHRILQRFFWTATCAPGAYTLAIRQQTAAGSKAAVGSRPKTISADVYLDPWQHADFGSSASAGRQIGTPGTARQAITVASYDFNDQMEVRGRLTTRGPVLNPRAPMRIGAISRYSNPGPRRDGLQKPDLAAPGQYHIAAVPLHFKRDPKQVLETTGNYRRFNGTSAATPYCAGVVALMFQKNPGLNVRQVRQLLLGGLTRDVHTGRVPGPRWGHGKLDLAAVRRILSSVPTARVGDGKR
ncbi:MAG: S8 family serine peptidase [Planctomycetes bacterium]|nr:S8 family serine peptidase [Planctomycetota bacterium]MCB9871241.1 S8 family serine peptidase [Planctomycetota bacterium]